MYVVKFALLLILVFIPSRSCVVTETSQKFSTFCHFSEGESKRELRELSFLSDIYILTSPLKNLSSPYLLNRIFLDVAHK